MQSPNQFIVKPLDDKRYFDSVREGDLHFLLSTSQEDASASNREAVVQQVPVNYAGPVGVGDHLLVHHNVFKFYYDMKGRQKNGRSYFKDGLFFVDDMQYFMWRKTDGDWQTVGEVCFVEPSKEKESWWGKFTGIEPLTGVIRYGNDSLRKKGVEVGDEIIFKPNSEYEFRVHDTTMYRTFTKNIVIKLSDD